MEIDFHTPNFILCFLRFFLAMGLLWKTISSFSSNPLFSAIVALYTLVFLYFPSPFRGIFFSPVLVSASVLVFSLLRLGASQRTARFEADRTAVEPVQDVALAQLAQPSSLQTPRDSRNDGAGPGRGTDPDPIYADSFVEWNVRAPLEVIHEEYEGDGEGEELNDDVWRRVRAADTAAIEKYASLSLYYPETDSDSCSSEGDFAEIGDWGSPENCRFRWEGEDREGLIEIKLDGKRSANEAFEEDNLIEIDLSPATANGVFCDEVLD